MKSISFVVLYLFGLETTALAYVRPVVGARPVLPASVEQEFARAELAWPAPPPSPPTPAAADHSPAAGAEPPATPAASHPVRMARLGVPVAAMLLPPQGGGGPVALDLNTFTREADPNQGAWNVSVGGSQVDQLLTAGASFLVSPADHLNTTLTGELRVNAAGSPHAGSVGLVLGYQKPVAANGDAGNDLDFVLLDWKRTDDPGAPEGFTLSRVLGAPPDPGATLVQHSLPEVQLLAQQVGAGLGWTPDTTHLLQVSYRSSRVRVWVDSVLIFDVTGGFAGGRLGFFTNGQSEASFSGFTVEPSNDPPVADAGTDQVLAAEPGCQASVDLDGSSSSDPDGDVLSFDWTGPFASVSVATPNVTVPHGSHSVTLTVDDGNGQTANDTVQIDVQGGSPPLLTCPADISERAPIGEGSVSGLDLGTPTTTGSCQIMSLTNDAPSEFLVGTTNVAWTAIESGGFSSTCVQTVTVEASTPPPPAAEQGCETDGQGSIVELLVDEDVLADFNVDPPVCTGDADLCGVFSYDNSGAEPETWKAIFDSGIKRLVVANGATVTVETVPPTTNGQAAPGIDIRSACGFEVEYGGAVKIEGLNKNTGPLDIEVEGDVLIDGELLNKVGGTLRKPGPIEIFSCRGDIVTGPQSRIETIGVDQGGSDIRLVTCGAGGDIVVNGLVRALHQYSDTPIIDVLSFGGSITVDGTNEYGIETVAGAKVNRTSGLLARTSRATLAGDINVQAKGDITVIGNANTTIRKQFSAIALGPHSTNGQGGDGDILVVSLEGDIVATDRAFEVDTRFNELNAITLEAAGDIDLSVTGSIDHGASDSSKPVVSVQAGQGATGGTNRLRAYSGEISVGSGAIVEADFTGGVNGADGINELTSCAGVVGNGLVIPADLDTSDDSGVCTPAAPPAIIADCDGAGSSCPAGPLNQPPSVNAGADQTIALPQDTATLSGSATDDGLPAGSTVTVSWSVLTSPAGATVTFGDATAPATTATFSTDGTYVLRLSASDGDKTGSDDVTITVLPPNQAPAVDAGSDQTIRLPEPASLSGAVSDDGLPAGGSVSVGWSQVSGPGTTTFADPTALATTASFSVDGVYVLRLTASDTQLQSSDDVQITVLPANQPPIVDAGADQTITLPTDTAALNGTVTDDFVPVALTTTWSAASGPAGGDVSFADPASADTQATFSLEGTYVLRLTASDGELQAFDDVTVTVEPPPIPVVSVADVTVTEGHQGSVDLTLTFTLSQPSASDVSVDFLTEDGSAIAPGDYAARAGTVSFFAGQTVQTRDVPVQGDLLEEGNETFMVRLGNPNGVILGADATMTIADDDGVNAPPTVSGFDPPDGATPAIQPTDLSWTFNDPDADAVSFDVYLGNDVATIGQAWTPSSPAGPSAPAARSRAASAYDEVNDRLIVFGGAGASGALGDLWVLENASGFGAAATWVELTPAGSPPAARERATAVYDGTGNRLVLFGGCAGACASGLQDAWVLDNANGLGGTATWTALPDAPSGRFAHVAGYDSSSNRMVVFSGSSGASELADVIVLENANGLGGPPTWITLAPAGPPPPARFGAAAAYDVNENRLFVFGGRTLADTALADTWILDEANGLGSPSWSELSVSSTPQPRSGHALAYDAAIDRVVVFGGTTAGIDSNTNFVAGDLWLLTDLGGATPTWIQADAGAVEPSFRMDVASAYSADRGTLIVAFGANNRVEPSPVDDVWTLAAAAGELPLVSQDQTTTIYALPALTFGQDYLWRVVARDEHGAQGASTTLRFTPTLPAFSVNDVAVIEGDAGTTDAFFNVTRTSSDTAASVDFTTQDDVALAGEDYTAAAGNLSFGIGVASLPLSVTVLGDADFEGDETFHVVLQSPVDATIADGDGIGTITNDDPPNQAPTVDAGPDQTIEFPVDTVTVGVTADDDGLPPGPLSITWTKISGVGAVTFGDPTVAVTTATFNVADTYVLRLTADDGELQTSDDVTVFVNPENLAPFVDAGPVQSTSLPNASVTLQGSASDDLLPPGSTLTTTWSFVSGPAAPTFADPTDPLTAATFTAAGNYVLRLTADDGALQTFDDTGVTVSPAAPADLVAVSVDTSGAVFSPQTLALSGTVAVDATNTGGATTGAFTVTFFEDLNLNGTFESGVDQTLGTTTYPGLAGGTTASLSAPVAGTLAFAGNLIFAFVDSGNSIAEPDEANNLTSSAATCERPPTLPIAGPLDAELEWEWVAGDENRVHMTPAVADLTGDGVPEVVFVTYSGPPGSGGAGQLRAVDGRSGGELFTVTDSSAILRADAGLAIGDIDGDGLPEIIGLSGINRRLRAFEHDGTVKWVGDQLENTPYKVLALADLDADGTLEVAAGRQLASAVDGTLLWTGSGDQGRGTSVIADIDHDGLQEIIAGPTAYRSDGTTLWDEGGTTGWSAVADLDSDGFAEVIVSATSQLRAIEHDGTPKWSVSRPGGSQGGAPTIGDIDGDGEPEIVVSGGTLLVAFEANGAQKWSVPIADSSSGFLTSTLFDFQADGIPEVVHADQELLRILNGADGAVLLEIPNSNSTRHENPVVADIDADGQAEIVLGGNTALDVDGNNGLRSYGGAPTGWVAAGTVWNQHPYHVTNINDDLSVPALEARNWETLNSYREQIIPAVGCVFAAADLIPSFLRIEDTGSVLRLTVRVGNAGTPFVASGVPVAFFDGDPSFGGDLIGTAAMTSVNLPTGGFEEVVLDLPLGTTTTQTVWVVADDDGRGGEVLVESNEANNALDSDLALGASSGTPDLAAALVDTSGVATDASLAVSGTVTAVVRNQGDADASGSFDVTFFEDVDLDGAFSIADNVVGSTSAGPLSSGTTQSVATSVAGTVAFAGSPLVVFVDSGAVVSESNEANNLLRSGTLCAADPLATPFATVIEWSWVPTTLPASSNVNVAPAVADVNADGIPDAVFTSFEGTSFADGHLRAVSGAGGAEIFTATDPTLDLWASNPPAVGDIDGDGLPEIVAVAESQTELLAFEHDGTQKWTSDTIAQATSAGPAIADLDGDGSPEIVIGRQALDADGALLWTGTSSDGPPGASLAHVADVDLDGSPEVIVGRAIYNADGTLHAQINSITDWYTAVGNLDADPEAEIVHFGPHLLGGIRSQLAVAGHDGDRKWERAFDGLRSGAPAVADFDGDSVAEIAIATEEILAVVSGGGNILWELTLTSNTYLDDAVGSPSAFDFDGDGAAELVYGDASSLRIFDGATGTVLATVPLGTCEGRYMTAIADVDADGDSELVVPVSAACDGTLSPGIHVVGDAEDHWVGARPVWNQHTYHITNVADDATLPSPETLSWAQFNSFRSTEVVNGFAAASPDLTASLFQLSDDGSQLLLSARVGNAGAVVVREGVSVAFYDGDPRSGGQLLGTALTTTRLNPGAFEDVTLALQGDAASAQSVWAVADDSGALTGAIRECDEDNNLLDSGEQLNTAPSVDAGPDQTLNLPQSTASLAGVVTDDGLPVGSAVSVSWTQVSGPSAVAFTSPNTEITDVTLGAAGDYVLRLTADEGALTASDDVTITLTPPNQAPAVEAGADITTLFGQSVLLQGVVNDDGLPSGSVSLAWSQLSGPGTASFATPTQANTTATFSAPGVYVLRLTADDGTLGGSDDVIVSLDGPPSVDAGTDETVVLPALQVTLNGVASDEGLPTGSLTTAWSLSSGPGAVVFQDATALNTLASFDEPGTYVLQLLASDGVQQNTDTVAVVIDPATPVGGPPVVQIDSPLEGDSLTDFTDVTGSVTSGTLLDWKLQYRIAGDTGAFTTFATDASEVSASVLGSFDPTLLLNGQFEVRLIARDTANRTAEDAVTVVVTDNLKIGNFTVSFVDLEVPVAGLPIRVTRTYDSREKRVRDFGVGWTLDISNVRVQENGTFGAGWQGTFIPGFLQGFSVSPVTPHVVTVTLPDGRVHEFEMDLNPNFQVVTPPSAAQVVFNARPGSLGTLTPVDDGVFLVGTYPGTVTVYSQTTYSLYDPTLYEYKTPDGRRLLVHDSLGLQTITDLNGNTLTVSASGITHSSGRGVTFQRDAEGRIETITDPEGEVMTYAYDASGDLVSYTDRETSQSTYTYIADHLLEDIVDPRGITPIRNEYFADGRLKKHIDAFGKEINYTHDIGTRQEIVTDRLLQQRVLEYDERGNVVKETQPDGLVILRTFDVNNNRLSETDPHDPATQPSPPTTTFTYDANDNLTSTTDPLNNTTSQTYDDNQRVLTTTDARSNTTTNAFDPVTGNLTSTTDAENNVTSFTYDGSGNVLTQTDAENGVTAFEYDGPGNLTKEIDAEGNETVHTYDLNGNRRKTTRTRTTPSGTETLVTTFLFDKNGRVTGTIDPDGTSSETDYDALGKQEVTRDKLGRETTFEYDLMGRLVKTTFPDLTTEEQTYDEEGRRETSKDRLDRVTSFEYDELGRVIKTTFPDLTETENFYDDAGRLVSVEDARGNVTTFEYDDSGRRTKVIDALLQETTFTYDPNGNQETVTDARGKTTTFEYDKLNRRTKTIFHDLTFIETGYNKLGRRISETDQAGEVTGFEYDALGRLTKVIDALSKETTYGYDELGNRISQTDANNNATLFEYDELGRQTKRTLPDGTFETMGYDAVGNRTSWTNFNGDTLTFAYDINNRLETKTFPDTSTETWSYTGTGRRESMTDDRGTTSYTYDTRDRLETLTYPDARKLTYDYDDHGNLSSLTADVAGQTLTTTYTYDVLNRLDTTTDSESRIYDYGYDPNGNRESLAYPNNVTTTWEYDDLNRLELITTVNSSTSTTIQSHDYALGAAGNRESVAENDGTTRSYTYDELYRLTGETVHDGVSNVFTKTFTYDDVGNRLTQDTVGTGTTNIAYTYDNRDRLETESGITYIYDDNGDVQSKSGEATYIWDIENRLIEIQKTDGTLIQHDYDPDGNRVQTVTTPPGGSAQTQNFLVDTSGSLSHVVVETDGAGALVAQYVRGDGELLAVIRPDGGGGVESRFYHADGLGSIRRLTNEAGVTIDGYTYTAFGELTFHTGTDTQPYAFTGEPLDLNSGFQYHRARWMDPRTGRFAGMDPFGGLVFDPPTLHRYLYAKASPANVIDPTGEFGEFSIGGLSLSMAIGATINSIANFNPEAGFSAFATNLAVGALQGAAGYGATLGTVRLLLRASRLVSAGRAARALKTIFGRVSSAGSNHPGTLIPRRFVFKTRGGRVFVNDNGTRHLPELLRRNPKGVPFPASDTRIANAIVLQSVDDAITQASLQGFKFGQKVVVGQWEMIFVLERNLAAGKVPIVLKHLQPLF